MEFITKFYKENTLDQLLNESKRLRNKCPSRLPVIIDRLNKHTQKLDKNKFLIPNSFTMGDILNMVRKRLNLNSKTGLYFYLENGSIPSYESLVSTLFVEQANKGGFLVIKYSEEDTFGCVNYK